MMKSASRAQPTWCVIEEKHGSFHRILVHVRDGPVFVHVIIPFHEAIRVPEPHAHIVRGIKQTAVRPSFEHARPARPGDECDEDEPQPAQREEARIPLLLHASMVQRRIRRHLHAGACLVLVHLGYESVSAVCPGMEVNTGLDEPA